MQAIGVVGTVGNGLAGSQPADQLAGWRHVVLLAGAKGEADGQAERVYDPVQLGTEAATRAAETWA